MSSVKRVYVEKKPAFAVQAKELRSEIQGYLGIRTVTDVRVLIRYDVENLPEDVFEKACRPVQGDIRDPGECGCFFRGVPARPV